MIDIKELNDKLNSLRGLDFEQAETQERAAGNNFPEMSFSKSFQARLASAALEVPVADIKELPIKQYNAVCSAVFNFLFSTSDEETASAKSGKSH